MTEKQKYYNTLPKEELIFLLVQCDEVIEDLHKEIVRQREEIKRLNDKIDYFTIPQSNA